MILNSGANKQTKIYQVLIMFDINLTKKAVSVIRCYAIDNNDNDV